MVDVVREWLTLEEAAVLLKLPKAEVRLLCQQGKLMVRAYRWCGSRHWMVLRQSALDYEAARKAGKCPRRTSRPIVETPGAFGRTAVHHHEPRRCPARERLGVSL